MSISTVSLKPSFIEGGILNSRCFSLVSQIAKKTSHFALEALAIYAFTTLPIAEAGAGAYWSCIQVCSSQGMNWLVAIGCPVVCAPFLLGPG
jgi:hypothetical protein